MNTPVKKLYEKKGIFCFFKTGILDKEQFNNKNQNLDRGKRYKKI